MVAKFLSFFTDKREVTSLEYVHMLEPDLEPFCKFPCNCGEQLILFKSIMPGEAAVLECDNCRLSWTVYNPTLVIRKTKELPENIQEVWAKLSNES